MPGQEEGEDQNNNGGLYIGRQFPERVSIRLDKWDISFDGNTEKLCIEDFIFRIEYLQQYHACPWKEILGDFHRFLKGEANDWFWLMVRHKVIRSWEDLKKELLLEYGSNRSGYEFMRDFEERRQRPGESIDAFFHVMKKLRSRLKTPLPDYEVARYLLHLRCSRAII